MYNISPLLIKMFNASVYTGSLITEDDVRNINESAIKKGYLIDPSICDDNAMKFIDSINTDYNSTFYKTWQDIVSENRIELYLDQILHYATVWLGIDYIANPDFNNPDQPNFSDYKIIKAISAEEMYNNCWNMITSGIALSHDVIEAVCDYIISFVKENNSIITVDDIVNKEANIYICDGLHICPEDKFNLLRYLVYKFTGKFDLIKNDLTIQSIKDCIYPGVDLMDLNGNQLKGLASIYYRFKPLFLAMRYTSPDNKKAINKIRRMADKYKEPFYPGKLETLLSKVETGCNDYYIKSIIKEASNFKLVALLQAIKERIYLIENGGYISYLIRNGKSFTIINKYNKIDIATTNVIKRLYQNAYKIIKNQLVINLSKKAGVVKFPNSLNLVCPTSEKNFIGNLPMGSNFDMKESSFFGIYWRNEWGAKDFDLSFTSTNGCKIGWDSWYEHDEDIIFSGDIVNAPNGANEVLYFKKGCPNGTINVNRFNGIDFSKFEIFFGHSDKPLKLTKNYMVDPNDVELRETITTTENMQTKIGFINDGKAYFMKMSDSNARTSREGINVHDINIRKANCFIDLKSILLEAGFVDYDSVTETDTVYTANGTPIKLENKILIDKKGNSYKQEDIINLDDQLDKASLIRLFTK